MNVLIVDDAPSKRELLSKFLVEQGLPAEKIHSAGSAREAREAVNSRSYDLLLIDLILPASSKGEARADVGFELLQEFVEDGRGGRIIGTTANLDAVKTYQDEFRQLAEQLLLIDGISQDWRESLRSLVQQIKGWQERPSQYNLDFCFLTAVRDVEYAALQKLSIEWGAEKVLPSGGLYREGHADVNGKRLHGLCAHAKQMGMVAACHLAQTAITEFRPRVLVMTGICGGLPGETHLGDLVIADKSWDWQSGKHTSTNGFVAAPDQKEATPELVALAKSLEADVREVVQALAGLASPGTTPKFVEGPMLTGSSVVATDELHDLFVAQHRKPVAVDMECYGVYYASRMSGHPAPAFVCLKGVSDLSNSEKGDSYQAYASALSAQVAWRLVKKYLAP